MGSGTRNGRTGYLSFDWQMILGTFFPPGKIMFLHLSVLHSFHRGEGVCPTPLQADRRGVGQTLAWMQIPLGKPPWADIPPGRLPWMQTPLGRPPWMHTPHDTSKVGSTHPTGMHTCSSSHWHIQDFPD